MTTQNALLEANAMRKSFGGFVALEDVDITVRAGERVGLIGPNGSGKSTLVNCLSGALNSDAGSIRFDGHSIERLPAYRRTRLGIVRTFQMPLPFTSMTVLDNLTIPLRFAGRHRIGAAADENDIEQALSILEAVGLRDKADVVSAALTQVEMRKLELARAVAARPKLLIADETMAGLSNAEVDEIIALLFKLNEQGIAIIMIEHIMRAVVALSQRAIVLVAGKKIADDAPDIVMNDAEVVRAYLGE
ncbi:MAG TPA: ABC transporter ATP-binding protein [Xanthobacteraceae bacterium]|nr:ABC transporter ATP-binding protein [Xanthobacteraceae bacterium]